MGTGKLINKRGNKMMSNEAKSVITEDEERYNKLKSITGLSVNLNFNTAIDALKVGLRVARRGWNGKGMYLFLCKPTEISYQFKLPDCDAELEHLESIVMRTADSKILVGWLASQSDMLASDWEVLSYK